MKYVITGGAGNISRPLVEKLLKEKQDVTVIGRNAAHLKPLTDKGAKAEIGSIDDAAFVEKAFAGADAVYTMVPPNMAAQDWKGYIGSVGKIYADAIKANKIKYVVNLSSVGAHMEDGCGPVSGLYRVEQALNALTDVNILHLRPAYFYNNLYGNIGMVKQMNILGGNYGGAATPMVMVDPEDIAAVAARALLELNFKGHGVLYIASDERKAGEIAHLLGAAVGKPELPWVEFKDEQALEGMKQAGLPDEVAKNFVEMGAAIRTGKMYEDYYKQQSVHGKVKLEEFAQRFAGAYQQG